MNLLAATHVGGQSQQLRRVALPKFVMIALQQEGEQGEHDLCYFDEAGFSLTPRVPYGWQAVGERLEIPSSKSAQLNVLGFLDYTGEGFDSYVCQGGVDAATVIACICCFCAKLTKPTTVVIDIHDREKDKRQAI